MKLYTEEQVIKAIYEARFYQEQIMPSKTIIKKLTPIELPSDEEIEKHFTIGVAPQTSYPHMIQGAKWMKDQIQNK